VRATPFANGELARGVAEVDAPIGGDVEIVREAEGSALGRRGEHPHLPRGIDGEEATDTVGHIERAVGAEGETERTAPGARPDLWAPALGIEPHDAPVERRGVEASLSVSRHALRAGMSIERDPFRARQGGVDGEVPDEAAIGWGVPCDGCDRHRPQGEIGEQGEGRDEGEAAGDPTREEWHRRNVR